MCKSKNKNHPWISPGKFHYINEKVYYSENIKKHNKIVY